MGKKENKNNKKSEEIIDKEQVSIIEANDEDKIESINQEIESNDNSDADYIHDESIITDNEFKKQLKEQKNKEKIKQKELYKQYKKDKKERKKNNKEALKQIKEKDARREFKIQKHEEELNIRSELGVKTPGERFSLYIRKTVLRGSLQTFLLVLILVTSYITINLYTQQGTLPKIDVTANKIYTLTDDTKEYIKTIEDDVKLYAYGFSDPNSISDFLKQYAALNDHISFEYLDGNSKPEILVKYGLQTNEEAVIIIETNAGNKVISSADLSSYDSITGEEIDLTEDAITNGIYSTLSKNKPNIYFLSGHDDTFTFNAYSTANSYLANNGFKINELNIFKTNSIPDDCDLIIISSISTDLYDKEAELIKAYINKGGNLLIMSAYNDKKTVSSFKNLKSIIDIYGTTIDTSGVVFEQDPDKMISGSNYFVLPTLSQESDVTKSLYDSYSNSYNNSFVALYLPGRIILPNEDAQTKNKLQVVTLAQSSQSSYFGKDDGSMNRGSSVLAAMITKTIKEGEEEKDTIKSSVILISDAAFCADFPIKDSSLYIVQVGKNAAFYSNSIAKLTDKEDFMSIRKTIYTARFSPTTTENRVVLLIIIFFPIAIILIGVIIKVYRNKRN